MIIQTLDSIRNTILLNINISMKRNLLMFGPSGTGKTKNIINELNTNYFN